MEVSKDYLEQLRQEDIEFFAKKYVEFFSDCFGKNSIEQRQIFYSEIKSILNSNVSEYIVDDTILGWSGGGESRGDKIYLSNATYEDQSVRIHELVHSFNHIDKKVQGLKDFNQNLILKNLDEGSTEMIAQLMVGNEKLEMTSYQEDVKLANFITNIVGKDIMIQATRGNPQILSNEIDRILGTSNFLLYLEQVKREYNELSDMSWGTTGFFGDTEVPKDEQLLAKLKLELIRNRSSIDILYDAIQRTNNIELIQKFDEVDQKYGYDYMFSKAISKKIEFDSTKPTLASVQQEQIKREIEQLNSSEYEPINELKIELLSFIYDQIDFQKYFVGKTNYEYGVYNLTEEDEKYSANFKSSLDGKSERLGGHLGIDGVGCRVSEINNVIFQINNEYANKIFISDLGFDELTDKRLEIISEQLLIAKQKEILKDSAIFIRNTFLAKEFSFFDVETLDEMISDLIKELDMKEQQIIDKYKKEDVAPIKNNEKQNLDNNHEIIVTKESIEQLLKVHLDVIRGYEHQIVNGQEIFMPVMKTTQELFQEQGRLFQKIEVLYDKGDIDLRTKKAFDSELIHQFNILKEKIDNIKHEQYTNQIHQESENQITEDQNEIQMRNYLKTRIKNLTNIQVSDNKGYVGNGAMILKSKQELIEEKEQMEELIDDLLVNNRIDLNEKNRLINFIREEYKNMILKAPNESSNLLDDYNQMLNQLNQQPQQANEKREVADIDLDHEYLIYHINSKCMDQVNLYRTNYDYDMLADEQKEELDKKILEVLKLELDNDESYIVRKKQILEKVKESLGINPDLHDIDMYDLIESFDTPEIIESIEGKKIR